jgi:hypothetical protein
MSSRDTIDGMTAAETILSTIIEQVANFPTDSAHHARSAVMSINRVVAEHLFVQSDKPYHHRVLDVSLLCNTRSQKPYIDKYEQQVYKTAATTALDYYEAVMYHEHMEAPLPF